MAKNKCLQCDRDAVCKSLCPYHYKMPSQVSPRPIKKNKCKINTFSDKKVAELALYRKQREKYFQLYPICQYPGCESNNISIHHMRGRIGTLLTDIKYFKSLCWQHHNWAELNPKEAKKLGLSLERL